DTAPARNPRMGQRRDGVDTTCTGQVDEGFELGQPCAIGLGACRATGKTRCSATFVTVVCDAMPGRPKPEVCDMIDNDCNGRVDDLPRPPAGAPPPGSGTVESCGGCAVRCPAAANSLAACVAGGCVARCLPGFVDLDRDPANGCECAISNGGVEI